MSNAQKILSECYTGAVHDVMRARGMRTFTLPPTLVPLIEDARICGPAFTIEGVTGDVDAHETLLAWTGLLSRAPHGSVWVCQPNDDTVALMGELSAETLLAKGVRGAILDGGARDTPFLVRLGFPVWRRFNTPRDIVGYWLPKAVDEPIVIGEVTINPRDIILADRDGVVVVPSDKAEEIAAEAHTAMNTENLVRKAILDGVDPQEAYRRFGKF
ncbi:MAG: RraA family protein [Devosia sp.]